ncbi:uncharacterized protein PFL1_06552 [Pseudozyma flocculosa PF-1]|uniref:Related to IST1 - protein with a positive role in the multivesicular body sorting pathway n=2 Tax=Pseudozyma flocculosa TaxID=84751 RepID=A0A5C3F8C4_9BASI|nr:uncharacterized protein PFL1_06552 [Pseudozyma flocculosa PF-1]EPQ25878.1 hypothetical protein PFL1_06552 [Pseudozyma flocculosa PF-1]SPO40622.1 related to IST1 - protein with a positive role in the multivesicular body sorting pathway [Pseudozyma flocculosa]
MAPWNAARTKVQLKLSVQRTKMLQEKKEAMAKKARRDIAALVERGKLETARIKTEGLIAEDIHIELLELMELYAETLLARFALLEMNTRDVDPSLQPALASIIHASPRTELKELHVLREMLMSKYGREFATDVMDNRDGIVPDRVMAKLDLGTAKVDEVLVEAYIEEICKAYDVPFHSDVLAKLAQKDQPADVEGAAAGEGQDVKPSAEASKEGAVFADAEKVKDEATKSEAQSTAAAAAQPPAATATTKKQTEQQEYDSLAARFAALKRM